MPEFVHQGKRYTLSVEVVESSLAGVEPEPVRQLAAGANGRWYPVKQAFVTPLGLKNYDVNSRVAFNHLKAAGIPVHDSDADGPLSPAPPTRTAGAGMPMPAPGGRREALGFTVELLRGTPGITAAQVIAIADELEAWLRAA